jgi:hypothetical protein
MPFEIGMPRPESRFANPDGTITRDWYLFIASLLQAVGGPSVIPGGGVAPIDNQMQFEEYAISVPDAMAALRGVDELRNELATLGNNQQALRAIYDELMTALDGIRNISDFRNRIDDIESLIEALRPSPLPLFPEQFIAPTLLNSWTNFGSGYNPAGYYKDPFGIVHLRGVIQTGASPFIIFRLPAGYLPANQEMFSVTANNAYGRVDVLTTGDVQFQAGNNTFVSLDGITFRASK